VDRARRVTIAVALVAAVARLPAVYTHALSEDEAASARILAEPSLLGMLRHVARTESTPPLWYALGWCAHAAGLPIADVRLLSVLAGALLAALVVSLALHVVPLPFAAVAGLFVAVGAEPVSHGSELRSYELLALLAVLLARVVLAEVEAPSRKTELGLAAVVAAGGLTHFFFAFSVLAALGWLWLDPGARAVRARATVAILCGGAVASAWAPVMLAQVHANRFWWIGPFRLRAVAAVPLRLFTYAFADTRLGLAVTLLALAVIATGAAQLARRSAAGRLMVALALAPTVEAALVWAAGLRIVALRNLIATAPFVAITAAAALTALPLRRVALAVAAAGVAALAVGLIGATPRVAPYDTIARRLVADGWHASQPVAVFGDFFRYRAPLEWYLPHRPILDASRPTGRACRTLFVIRGTEVVRLRDARPSQLRHSTILADPVSAPACVRPIRRGRLAALS
jgi:hypothetical protein